MPTNDDDPEVQQVPNLELIVERPFWMERANCRGLDPALFFPERGEMVSEKARQVCAECEVSYECLIYALEIKERDGVWGGQSGRQRRDLRAAAVDRNHERTCIECGITFMGNYRSRLCSQDCRVIRQASRPRRPSRGSRAAGTED